MTSVIGWDGMQEYPLSCITVCFNVGALPVFNVGMMKRRDCRQKFQRTTVWNFWLGVGDFGLWKIPEWYGLWSGDMWFRIGNVFGIKGSSGVDIGSCEFLGGKHLVVWTCVIIMMQVKFWPLQSPRFSIYRSLQKENRGSEDTRMDYQYLKTHYNACGQRSVRWISSDQCESFGINWKLHSWLPVITSGGWISQKLHPVSVPILTLLWLRL